LVVSTAGGALSSSAVLMKERFMIVLKKDNHYEHTDSREIAQAKVNDGFEVIKNSYGGPRIVKQAAEPKKKMFSKKK